MGTHPGKSGFLQFAGARQHVSQAWQARYAHGQSMQLYLHHQPLSWRNQPAGASKDYMIPGGSEHFSSMPVLRE
jgi:hypothetical protein